MTKPQLYNCNLQDSEVSSARVKLTFLLLGPLESQTGNPMVLRFNSQYRQEMTGAHEQGT